MRHRSRWLAVVVAASLVALPGAAMAHPDHAGGGGGELFPGEGVVSDGSGKQHDGDEGHLPAKQENVTVVGKGGIKNPKGTTGRVADVFASGDYAYLTAFHEPVCTRGGVHVMDISLLDKPKEVVSAFIPTSEGSYAGEGIQVIDIGGRDVLIHQNETCSGATPAPGTSGGINLWDVTNPRKPVNLAMHAGDYTNPDGTVATSANTVHSMYAWTDDSNGQTYVVLVDNEEFTDVDIMNITDPTRPQMVNDTLDLVDLFAVDQASPEGLTSIFSHDMTVKKIGERYVMNMNYWDGGYVLLDVTDPTPGNVSLIAESDYAELDEERLKRGQEITPEGNAHQSEFSPDNDFLIGTDEDFNPYRVEATITSGDYTGDEFVAVQASGTPAIDDQTQIAGTPTFLGRACAVTEGAVIEPVDGGVALIERGVCPFQEKLDAITAAGYDAGIVMNNTTECDGLVSMLAEGSIPFVFVDRTTGLKLLGSEDLACATPAAVTEMAGVSVSATFDGWGYVRLFETDVESGSITQVDGDGGTYAIPESQDAAFAVGHGDLSVHEVAMDPDPESGLAYLSYYAGGLRVVQYGETGMTEVGAFIDEGGSNLWGVEVYERDGQTYVLASDRDFGLYVLQYTP